LICYVAGDAGDFGLGKSLRYRRFDLSQLALGIGGDDHVGAARLRERQGLSPSDAAACTSYDDRETFGRAGEVLPGRDGIVDVAVEFAVVSVEA
jgi:hypothetical protein